MSKRVKIIVGVLVAALVVTTVGLFANTYNTNKKQSKRIKALEQQNTVLLQEMDDVQMQLDKLSGKVEYPEDSYNYLAIGNSITKHDGVIEHPNDKGMKYIADLIIKAIK